MRWIWSLTLLLCFSARAQNSLPSIGQWREHFPYGGVLDIAATETRIFAATPFSLYSLNFSDGEVQRFSTVSGLSETGVRSIAYDPTSKKLFVAYSNSNIDVLTEGSIRNIPDIKRSNIAGDKNIYSIYPDNLLTYLSTGLGVIVLDAQKLEIKDSWFLGVGGSYLKTNNFTKTAQHYYAATDSGLLRSPITNPNPADFSTWEMVPGSAGEVSFVTKIGTQIYYSQNDSIFSSNTGFIYSGGMEITYLGTEGANLIVNEKGITSARVREINTSGSIITELTNPSLISDPRKTLRVGSSYWVGDMNGGLSKFSNGIPENFRLNSPHGIALGQMLVSNGIFYAASGAVNDAWNYQYNRSGIYRFEGGFWTNYNQYSSPKLDSTLDFIAIAIDPRDGSLWGGSYGGGLVHIKDNNITIYKQNSPLGETVGDPGSYRIGGLAFDRDNNLWVSNFGSNQQLHVLKNNGTWKSFAAPFFIAQNAVSNIVIDDEGKKWILSPLGNGVIVFDEKGTIDQTSDDQWRFYRAGSGAGNLPSNEVTSIAKDKAGFIWIGTTNGVGVVQCAHLALSTGCDARWPVIKEGAFANYLFKGESVNSIVVDGGDRKWIATNTGLYLVSIDGDKVLQHFTESNSPLPVNDVKTLAIDGQTGELYVGTTRGLVSFRADATEAVEEKSSVQIFPNPVRPDFNGTIGIRGLPNNAWVKITELNGRLVYQGRAQGGQATWNGRDYKGQKVSSGIYLVLATDEFRQEQRVGRIVIVR